MAKAGELNWSELLYKAPMPIKGYDANDVPDTKGLEGLKPLQTQKLRNGLEYRSLQGYKSNIHVLYHPEKKEILSVLKTTTEHDDTDSGDKVKHDNAVFESKVNPKYKGKGLGKQLYMATMLHHGPLSSDISLSQKAHDAWKSFRSNPHLKVKLSPYNEDSPFSRHTARIKDSESFDHDLAFPDVDFGD